FILLIIKPIKAVEFALFILILQQIDGNIIGPKILGGSLGLPALWVMFAIIVGGSLFGILGMFFAVPVFSVIYVLIRDQANRTLSEKNINI
ncbi:MAG: AI-2E family transporter, partial [Erysipelotrichia bacterium]|nr:AI-2E family transporter [Erysipelotrichia bacterium]